MPGNLGGVEAGLCVDSLLSLLSPSPAAARIAPHHPVCCLRCTELNYQRVFPLLEELYYFKENY